MTAQISPPQEESGGVGRAWFYILLSSPHLPSTLLFFHASFFITFILKGKVFMFIFYGICYGIIWLLGWFLGRKSGPKSKAKLYLKCS